MGDITARIAQGVRNRPSEWNEHVYAFEHFIDERVQPVVLDALARVGLPSELLRFIKLDLVCYWQELNYRDVFQPAFYHVLWALYAAGHMPCGWDEADQVLLYR